MKNETQPMPTARPWNDGTHKTNGTDKIVPAHDYDHAMKCVNACKRIGDLTPEQFVGRALDDRHKIETDTIEAGKLFSEEIDKVDVKLNDALKTLLDPKEGAPVNIQQACDLIHSAMVIYNKFLPKD